MPLFDLFQIIRLGIHRTDWFTDVVILISLNTQTQWAYAELFLVFFLSYFKFFVLAHKSLVLGWILLEPGTWELLVSVVIEIFWADVIIHRTKVLVNTVYWNIPLAQDKVAL
jgi:hypothetical protein